MPEVGCGRWLMLKVVMGKSEAGKVESEVIVVVVVVKLIWSAAAAVTVLLFLFDVCCCWRWLLEHLQVFVENVPDVPWSLVHKVLAAQLAHFVAGDLK